MKVSITKREVAAISRIGDTICDLVNTAIPGEDIDKEKLLKVYTKGDGITAQITEDGATVDYKEDVLVEVIEVVNVVYTGVGRILKKIMPIVPEVLEEVEKVAKDISNFQSRVH